MTSGHRNVSAREPGLSRWNVQVAVICRPQARQVAGCCLPPSSLGMTAPAPRRAGGRAAKVEALRGPYSRLSERLGAAPLTSACFVLSDLIYVVQRLGSRCWCTRWLRAGHTAGCRRTRGLHGGCVMHPRCTAAWYTVARRGEKGEVTESCAPSVCGHSHRISHANSAESENPWNACSEKTELSKPKSFLNRDVICEWPQQAVRAGHVVGVHKAGLSETSSGKRLQLFGKLTVSVKASSNCSNLSLLAISNEIKQTT